MRYLSVCSGIEAASVAWHPLGWECVGVSEIDPFACAVLAHRYPDVPNLGSLENYREWPLKQGDIDLLVGGTPCQAFSVAGLRRGLDDPRGNLALTYLGLVDRLRPRWVVWENVPGVLSSNGGRDFGAFLGGLAQLGYGFAYRVMDAQYVRVESHPRAVPQRRRRVFVVGCAGGDWQRAARILLEPEGVRGDPPTRRQTREEAPRRAQVGATGSGIDFQNVALTGDVSGTILGEAQKKGGETGHGVVVPGPASFPWPVEVADPITANEQSTYTHEGTTFRMHNVVPDVAVTLTARMGKGINSNADEGHTPVVYALAQVTNPNNRSNPRPGDPALTLDADAGRNVVVQVPAVAGTLGGASQSGGFRTTDLDNSGAFIPAVSFHSNMGGNDGGVYEDGSTPKMTTERKPAVVVAQVPPVAAPTLTAASNPSRSPQSAEITHQVQSVFEASMAVRRLTPLECERLQGFPDGWTLIPWRKGMAKDGSRYKVLGNSMAVNVMRWIGERIAFTPVEEPQDTPRRPAVREQLSFAWSSP